MGGSNGESSLNKAAFSYQPSITDSQEIRIGTLENIIQEKINYINELENKL
jgi:hypothetical protein